MDLTGIQQFLIGFFIVGPIIIILWKLALKDYN